jgi:hypothetical protein
LQLQFEHWGTQSSLGGNHLCCAGSIFVVPLRFKQQQSPRPLLAWFLCPAAAGSDMLGRTRFS